MFKTRPAKTAVRAFSRAVQAAALKSVGRKLPPSPSYTAYWLVADGVSPSLLLTTVPLAALPDTLQKIPWRPMDYEAFRAARKFKRAFATVVSVRTEGTSWVGPLGSMTRV